MRRRIWTVVSFAGVLTACAPRDAVIDPAYLALFDGWETDRYWTIERSGAKVGWFAQRFRVDTTATPPVVVGTERLRLTSPDTGPLADDVTVTYALTGDGEILAVHGTRRTPAGVETMRVTDASGGRVRWIREGGAAERDEVVPRPRQTLRSWLEVERWLAAEDGTEFEQPIAFWFEEQLEGTRRMRVTDRRPTTDGAPTFVVAGEQSGVACTWELRPDGALYAADFDGWRYLERPADDALWFPDAGVAVFVDLEDPATIRKLELRWRGVTADVLPQSARQRFVREADGAVHITITRDAPDDTHPAEPLTAAERERWLAADALCDLADPRVAAFTAAAAAGLVDAAPTAERMQHLIDAVRAAMTNEITSSFMPASAVLARGSGDCKGAAVLFVAAARAAGLPSRIVTGFAYEPRTTPPSFCGHAWAEVHDGERWREVDAAFDQVFVDAVHIALTRGTIEPVAGWASLDVDVVAVERDG